MQLLTVRINTGLTFPASLEVMFLQILVVVWPWHQQYFNRLIEPLKLFCRFWSRETRLKNLILLCLRAVTLHSVLLICEARAVIKLAKVQGSFKGLRQYIMSRKKSTT